jgi:hypothetical protein
MGIPIKQPFSWGKKWYIKDRIWHFMYPIFRHTQMFFLLLPHSYGDLTWFHMIQHDLTLEKL